MNNRGVLGVNANLLRDTQITQLNSFQLQAKILEDRLATGQNREVFQHGLATITVARCFDRTNLQDATQFVDDQRCQSFAFDVFGDDQQWQASLGNLFQQRDQRLGAADLFFAEQNPAVVEFNNLVVCIGHEVRRQETSLELHPFDEFDFGVDLTALFDRDHAVFANLQQGICQNLADFFVVVTGDSRDSFDALTIIGFDGLGELLQFFNNRIDSLLGAAADCHGIVATGDVAETVAENRFGQHCRGGRSVPGNVTRLGSSFLHELHTHVFELVLQIDVLSDGHTVLGHLRRTPPFVEHRIAATWAQGTLDCTGQLRHAFEQALACLFVITDQLSHSDSSTSKTGLVGQQCSLCRAETRCKPRCSQQSSHHDRLQRLPPRRIPPRS